MVFDRKEMIRISSQTKFAPGILTLQKTAILEKKLPVRQARYYDKLLCMEKIDFKEVLLMFDL